MDFQDRMETGRTLAAARRARGLHTGKAAAGWERKPDTRPPHDWHELIEVMIDFVLTEAVNDINYAGGNPDGCSDIPF
jgi:hypothetical protein